MKKSTNAILLSFFAFTGFGGIGHFYLGKFKEGFCFVLVGVIAGLVNYFMIVGTGQIGMEYAQFLDDSASVVTFRIVYFVVPLVHILYILKKEK